MANGGNQQHGGNQQRESPSQSQVELLQREVAEMRAKLEQLQSANVASTSIKSSEELFQLLTRITGALDPQEIVRTAYEKESQRLQKNINESQNRLERLDVELAEGPKRYLIYTPGMVYQARVVGAADEHNAVAKYKRFWNIIATDQKENPQIIDFNGSREFTGTPDRIPAAIENTITDREKTSVDRRDIERAMKAIARALSTQAA